MCGIAGFLNFSYSDDQFNRVLFRMAGTMIHRGPDSEGIWFDKKDGIGLAHRRLAVIDTSPEGHQPMKSHSGRYMIVYNGEVYNFELLRKSLRDERIQWRGHSDTEVILQAVETWGLKRALERFTGMFAFALWDREKRILYLVRDRLGIKPLYYFRVGNGVVFGSELKALKAHPAFNPEIDRNALPLYLRYNYIPAPQSIYHNTWKLQPGQMIKIPADSLKKEKILPDSIFFWSAGNVAESGQQRQFQYGMENAVDQLETLLREAVKMRMIADVPLGCFLSGGIDSSLVAALMQVQSKKPVKTFTLGFNDIRYNEAGYAKNVAQFLGTDHTEMFLSMDDVINTIPKIPELYDEPFSDSSQIPTFLLSKLTRRHVTVSLSGDGGDELFGGYNRHFLWQSIYKYTDHMPIFLKKFISNALRKVSPSFFDNLYHYMFPFLPDKYKLGMPGYRIHKFAGMLATKSAEDMYHYLVSHWKEPEKIVINGFEPLHFLKSDHLETIIPDFAHKMMYLDLINYLPDDILTKIDRASMGVSLEARVPFLDHRVVAFAWQLPISMKIRNNQGKWILKKILYKYVPKKLLDRPKMGFAIPLDNLLRGPLRDWSESLLDKKRLIQDGFFNPEPIQKKWKEHLSGRFNWQDDLWDIIMFQSWLEKE